MRPLRGWILVPQDTAAIPEFEQIARGAGETGHTLEMIRASDVIVQLMPPDPEAEPFLFVGGVLRPVPDYAIAAFFGESSEHNLAVLRLLESYGIPCLNKAWTLRNCADKFRTLCLAAAAGIRVPKTLLLDRKANLESILKAFSPPVILKTVTGSRGTGVLLARTERELANLIASAHATDTCEKWLLQEFIAASEGRDVRIFVADKKPIGAILRQSAREGEFKANLSMGGTSSEYPLDAAALDIAQRAIHALDLEIGGIDLLFAPEGGYYLCEVNSMPGFFGFRKSTGIDVPRLVLESVEKRHSLRTAPPWRVQKAFSEALGNETPFPEYLAELPVSEINHLSRGMAACPRPAQEALLMDILRSAAHTEFAREHNFNRIESADAFRKKMPLTEYADYASRIERLKRGETDLLFAGKAVAFVITSGTSSETKFIPESELGAQAKAATLRARLEHFFRLIPSLKDPQTTILPLANSPRQGHTEAGIPFGAASGFNLGSGAQPILKKICLPLAVSALPDGETKEYLTIRFALAATDLGVVVGNNAARFASLLRVANDHADTLIQDIASGTLPEHFDLPRETASALEGTLRPDPERATALRAYFASKGRFDPADVWPDIAAIVCWTGSTIGENAREARRQLPPAVRFVDWGYGASEGLFNIPVEAETSEGLAALAGAFMEFLPTDADASSETLLLDETQEDTDYELVVTTYAGLYRYRMHDLVRITRRDGLFFMRFRGRAGDVGNLAGEKLYGEALDRIARRIAEDEATPLLLVQAAGSTLATEKGPLKRYIFCVEPSQGARLDAARFLSRLDEALRESEVLYRAWRERGVLGPPALWVLKSGWRDYLYAERQKKGGSGAAQIKLPVMTDASPPECWVTEKKEL